MGRHLCAAAGARGSAHGRPGPAAFNGLASLARGRTLQVGGRPAYRPTLAAAAALVATAAARIAASSRLRRRLVGATLPDSRDRTSPERTVCSDFNRPRGAAAGCRSGANRAPLVGGRPVQTRARRPLGLSGPDGRLRSQSGSDGANKAGTMKTTIVLYLPGARPLTLRAPCSRSCAWWDLVGALAHPAAAGPARRCSMMAASVSCHSWRLSMNPNGATPPVARPCCPRSAMLWVQRSSLAPDLAPHVRRP